MNKNTFFYQFFVKFFLAIYHFFVHIYHKFIRGMSAQELYNEGAGLPKDWRPAEYLGPKRGDEGWIRTPGGIRIRTSGFDREDVPLMKKGPLSGTEKRARLVLQEIDRIWASLLTYYSKPGKHGFGKAQMKQIANLPPDYPLIEVWPTIQWSTAHGCYVGGLCINERIACVTVWYESVSDLAPPAVTNWEDYLTHEFGHVINYVAGVGSKEPSSLMFSKVKSL